MNEIPWYAIHTHALQEARAEDNLARQQVETFLPRILVHRLDRYDQSVTNTAPLFSRYLFGRIPDSMLARVRSTRGVHSIVGVGDVPLAIEDAIIEQVRARVGEDGFVKLDSSDPLTCRLDPDQTVRILDGPFGGLEGVFQRATKDNRRVQILLNAVYRVEVDRRSVVAA